MRPLRGLQEICMYICMYVLVAQLCPAVCDLMDCSLPLFIGFSRQESWSGLPFPSPGNLPDPGIEPASLVSPMFAGRFFTTEPPGKPYILFIYTYTLLLLLLLLCRFSRVRLCATPYMAAHQAPPSLGCSRQEYWSGLPFFFIKVLVKCVYACCIKNS